MTFGSAGTGPVLFCPTPSEGTPEHCPPTLPLLAFPLPTSAPRLGEVLWFGQQGVVMASRRLVAALEDADAISKAYGRNPGLF